MSLIFKRIKLSLLVCLFTTIPVFAQSNAWVRYKAEGFSVLLPEHPNTMEIARPSKLFEKYRAGRLFSAYEDRVAYVILAFENPKHRDPLSRFIDDMEKLNVSGKAERFQKDLTGAGFTGKEYGFSNGPTINGVIRFYLAEDRVYILEAVGEDVSKPSVQRFLDSFLLESGDGANNISYASTEAARPAQIVGDQPDQQQIFSGKDVTAKARVLLKPEPMYTETARQAQTTGTVVLRGVFTSTGHVTKLRAVSELPNGLTERAIEAVRNIKFIPAMKDGRYVSMYIQLEYNFNLY
jgi:TonB family protein